MGSAFAGMNGADPNSGHLLPQQLLAPSPLVLPASGESGFDRLAPVDVQTTSAMLAGGGGSSGTLPTTSSGSLGSTMVGAAGGLQFDLVWDSSVSSAPAGFQVGRDRSGDIVHPDVFEPGDDHHRCRLG